MKKSLVLLLGITLAFWSSGQNSRADQKDFPAAGTGNAFLDIGAGARAVAMGEAFTGIADDITSLYWNPAGLGQVDNVQITLMHNQWFQNVIYEYGAGSLPVWKGALGFSTAYVSYGSMDKLDESGINLGSFTAYDLNLATAYGMKISDNLLLGAGLKLPITVIDNEAQVSFAADLGFLYKIPGLELLQIGINIMNVGTNVGAATQPSQIKLGLGLVEAVTGLKLGLDVSRHIFENPLQVNVGAEYMIMNTLAPRIGYKITTEDAGLGSALVGLTVGLGFYYYFQDFVLGLDYAYVPYGYLGDTHRIALSLALGAAPTKPPATSASWGQPSHTAPSLKTSDWNASYKAPAKPVAKPLLPPTRVSLKKAGSHIKVSWKSSSSSQRAGYNVYMKKGKKGKYYKVNKRLLRKNSYTTPILRSKRTYSFIVKTVDSSGRKSRGTAVKKLYFK
jgi:hypothetical protein